MTKKELARLIAEDFDITHKFAQQLVQGTFDRIIDVLVKEGRIELRNFGVFMVKQRGWRKAHVPPTGQIVDVAPRRVITFRAGREMEDKVQVKKPAKGRGK